MKFKTRESWFQEKLKTYQIRAVKRIKRKINIHLFTKINLMNKLKILTAILISTILISCSSKKETPASIAKKWCDLNAKAHQLKGAAQEAADEEVEKFEKQMEAKYGSDEAFMKQIEDEVEKCEAASEGR